MTLFKTLLLGLKQKDLKGEKMMKKGLMIAVMLLSTVAFAEEGAEVVTTTVATAGNTIYYGFAAAIAMGLAALGGAIAQGLVGSAAMEGIGRNPNAKDKMQTPMILGLVFIETLALFTFVIAIMIMGQ